MKERNILPEGWEKKKLFEVCEIQYGTRVVRKKDGGTMFPVYGGGGATFFMDVSNREDSLVIARFAMSEKCTRFIAGKFFLNDSGLTVIPNTEKKINQKFLDWQFISLNDYIYSLARGAAQKNLNIDNFKKTPICFPTDINEQKRIVKILDEVFENIEEAKKIAEENLKNAKQIFESYLENVFEKKGEGWQEEKLGNIVDIKTGKLDSNAMVENGKYPFFTCSRKIFAIDEYAFDCKAVLLAGNNASGDFNVKYYEGKFNAYQRTYVITIIDDNKLLYTYLKHKLIHHLSIFKAQSLGANTKFLKIGMIKGVKMILPPIQEQKKIVDIFDKLSKDVKDLEEVYRQKIEKLEELKKSILERAFCGEL